MPPQQVIHEFLADIRREVAADESKEVYATLAKILGNIIRNPSEPKFRSLKKDKKLVAEHICISMAAVSLLLLLGFEDQGDVFHCPMATDLEQMQAASELLGHMTMCLDELEQPRGAEQSQAPQPVKSSLVLKGTPKVSESERQREQAAGQLQALRAARAAKHREAAGVPSPLGQEATAQVPTPQEPSKQPAVDLLTGEADKGAGGEDLLDLMSEGPRSEVQRASYVYQSNPCTSASSVEDARPQKAQAPKTVYDFQKRESPQRPVVEEDLDEVRRARKEKFQQNQTGLEARTQAFQLPASAVEEDRAEVSPSKQEAPPARSNANPQDMSSWIAEASDRLSFTGKQLSNSLKESSEHLSARLSDLASRPASGWGGWGNRCEAIELGGTTQVGTLPARFRVTAVGGLRVRQSAEKSGQVAGVLPRGAEFVGLEACRLTEGDLRLRLEQPLQGWLTWKPDLLERVPEDPAEFG